MEPEHRIPENEHDNIISVYWAMLKELESKGEKDVYIKRLVSGGYNVLNRIEFTDARPTWEK